jgi:hypothetical protein
MKCFSVPLPFSLLHGNMKTDCEWSTATLQTIIYSNKIKRKDVNFASDLKCYFEQENTHSSMERE